MANEPVNGSRVIAAVRNDKDVNGQYTPVRLIGEPLHGSLPALVADLEDAATRDLGIVTVDGTVSLSAGTAVLGAVNTGLSGIYTEAFDYDGTTKQVIYHGWAAPGTAKTSAAWAIVKFTYNGDGNVTDIQWAGGAATFATVWNDRVSASYS